MLGLKTGRRKSQRYKEIKKSSKNLNENVLRVSVKKDCCILLSVIIVLEIGVLGCFM